MKKMTKLLAVALVAVMLLTTLVSCGSAFGKIKKNFEKAGYTYVSEDADGNSMAKTITAELEDGNLDCTVHVFKGEGAFGVPVYAMVLEFKSDKELAKAFAEEGSETLKGLIKDAQNSEYVRDNCVLVALTITQQDEMKGIFNQ
jgi:major membrane immunogen (membrane-anchored lipoprotein)